MALFILLTILAAGGAAVGTYTLTRRHVGAIFREVASDELTRITRNTARIDAEMEQLKNSTAASLVDFRELLNSFSNRANAQLQHRRKRERAEELDDELEEAIAQHTQRHDPLQLDFTTTPSHAPGTRPRLVPNNRTGT